MIVICEKCGRKNEISPSLVTRRETKIKCKACNHPMTVRGPAKDPQPAKATKPSRRPPAAAPQKKAAAKGSPFKTAGIGLRGKLLFFFLVPLILALSIGGLFTLREMDALGKTMTGESLRMLVRVSENEVREYAKAIAQQIQIYLTAHPELKKEDFNNDIEFKKIAVQRINLTMRGYTSLYEPTEEGKVVFLAHVNPKYVGQDVNSLQNLIGDGFNQFNRMIQVGRGGIETNGYYLQSIDGRPRDNYLVCTPVKGSPYYVSCTTYLDESTLGVVAIPMSPEFKTYLDLMVWPQENDWWKSQEWWKPKQ